jgi:large subunit ribosomal protein L4
MAKLDVLKLNGEKASTVELNDAIWNIEVNEIVLSEAVRLQMASLRQGTHDTKGRSEVSGGGKKPWRQKGTGRARQGSIRAPHWVGGAIVFGPTPRSHSFKMNKKERRLAIKSALSDKLQNKEICVVDSLELTSPKTKEFNNTLNTLNLNGKTLIVTDGENGNVVLASRNMANLHVIEPSSINVLDLVGADNLLIDVASVNKIEEVLK